MVGYFGKLLLWRNKHLLHTEAFAGKKTVQDTFAEMKIYVTFRTGVCECLCARVCVYACVSVCVYTICLYSRHWSFVYFQRLKICATAEEFSALEMHLLLWSQKYYSYEFIAVSPWSHFRVQLMLWGTCVWRNSVMRRTVQTTYRTYMLRHWWKGTNA